MIKFRRSLVGRVTALMVALLLLQVDFNLSPQQGQGSESLFDTALKEYQQGLFQAAAAKLESILNAGEAESPALTARVYLLLAACCEKLGKSERVRESLQALKEMLDAGLIDRLPEIGGIEPGLMSAYREIFAAGPFFKHKEPIPVADMLKDHMIHVPRKSRQDEKKRRKFPWLLAVSSAVIVGALVVLLLTRRGRDNEPQFPDVLWVTIPAGEFLMGDNFTEGDADERPVHSVYLDEYYISKTEITIAQYDYFCRDTGRERLFIPGTGLQAMWELPAFSVSWIDADAFCRWLSQRIGRDIHLPSEAQWEKAARGTYQYRYPWGNSAPDCKNVNYAACSDTSPSPNNLASVGSLFGGVSPYGAYEMAGNVAEWCRDWYSASYYADSPYKNPPGPAGGTARVIRGGSIADDPEGLRSANRDSRDPAFNALYLGFRVVMK